MPFRQSLKAFQDSYANDKAHSATLSTASSTYTGSDPQAVHTPSGDNTSANACHASRRAKNEKRFGRLVMACQLYAPVALVAAVQLSSEALAISGLCAVCLGIGLVAGAWMVEV